MEFITTHNKSYRTIEESLFKKAQFNEIDSFIHAHNSNTAMTFTVGHKKFSNWTNKEYKRLLDFKDSAELETTIVLNNTISAASVNCVSAGAVQAVRGKAQCSSCWIFFFIKAIESTN